MSRCLAGFGSGYRSHQMQYLACAINGILMEHMDMDISRNEVAAGASNPSGADGEFAAADIEFWDACWTLEDEWQPHVVSPRSPARSHVTAATTEVYGLL